MKKWMAALCLLGLLTGCTAMTEKNGSLQSEKNEPQTAENGVQSEENTQNMGGKNGTDRPDAQKTGDNDGKPAGETAAETTCAEYAAGSLRLSVPVPEGWTYELLPWTDAPGADAEAAASQEASHAEEACGLPAADSDAGMLSGQAGFTFRPEEAPEFRVELFCWLDGFGMCGTGVDFREISLKNGKAATLATETIDGETWRTLIYREVPGSYIAQWNGDAATLDAYEETIFDMLGMAELGCESLPEAEIAAIAAASCGREAADAVCRFDVRAGLWSVWFNEENGTARTVLVTPGGEVTTTALECG